MPTIHGSSPAVVADAFASNLVTASFSPPADSLLVAVLMGSTASPVMSNSGTGRTWTQRVQNATEDGVRIFTAPNPTALTNITVTATAADYGLKVYVVTGHHPTSYIGATGSGSSTTNAFTVDGYTSTGGGSRGILGALDFSSTTGLPTSTDDEDAWRSTAAGMAVTKAADTATAGTVVQFDLDKFGTAAANWHWVAVEILSASLDASAGLTIVEVVATVPAPDVSTGASTTLTAVTASVTTPAPAVSAGASTTLTAVDVPVTVPAVAVTLDETEVVTPDTVAVSATVPDPGVSAASAALLDAVAATVAVYAPSVSADFNADVTLPVVAVSVDVPQIGVTVPVLPGDQLDGLPGQIEWNGFVIGRNAYRWTGELEGWRGKEPPDSGNAPRANRSGSSPGRPLAREKTVMLPGLLKAPREEVEQAVLALENATPLLRNATQWPIVVNDLGTPYLAYGRIDRVHIPVGKLLRIGHGKIVLQWILAEPRRYNINATGVTVPIDTIVEIINAGNVETNPLLVIPGPVTTPRLHNLTLDRVTEWNVTVPDGQELRVDTDLGTAKTFTSAGVEVANVIGDMSFGSVSVWDWVLDRGTQEVEYTAASGGSQAEVLYRDAWL